MATPSPAKQLDGFLAKYAPAVAKQAKAALRKMRARLPGAVEMVYDNFNWLVIGFSPTERPSDAVFSLVLPPGRMVTLCFLRNGPRIPDPKKLLRGSGTRVRSVRLEGADDLDKPAIKTLMNDAVTLAGDPFHKTAPRRMVIRAIAAKQRPRQ